MGPGITLYYVGLSNVHIKPDQILPKLHIMHYMYTSHACLNHSYMCSHSLLWTGIKEVSTNVLKPDQTLSETIISSHLSQLKSLLSLLINPDLSYIMLCHKVSVDVRRESHSLSLAK